MFFVGSVKSLKRNSYYVLLVKAKPNSLENSLFCRLLMATAATVPPIKENRGWW